MRERVSHYRPAAAAFLTMMAMALTTSTLGFFMEPMCDALGIGRASFSMIFSLMSVSGALVSPFLGQYMGKRGVRKVLLFGGAWTGLCFCLLSLAKSAWMLYALGLAMGVMSSACVALCATVMVQQAYSGAQASGILGGVMAGSGVGGMIFSILIPWAMGAFGWQVGMLLMGVCWMGLLWTGALLLGKQERLPQKQGTSPADQGMTRTQALKSKELYLMMGLIIIVCICCGIQQQLPSLLHAQHYSESTVSLMISVMTATLAAGKLAQGLLYGKIGVQKGGIFLLTVFGAGFLALLYPPFAWPGLILLALGLGTYTTLLPQVARRIFGSREYAPIWALIAAAGNAGTFLANPLWGSIYDVTGAYTIGLLGCAVLSAVAVWILILALKRTED